MFIKRNILFLHTIVEGKMIMDGTVFENPLGLPSLFIIDMVEILHQLRLVVYPIIYEVYTSQVVFSPDF